VILTFTAMWIDLEDTMLNKISQAQKENIAWSPLHVEYFEESNMQK
jgi:hypothetical protein